MNLLFLGIVALPLVASPIVYLIGRISVRNNKIWGMNIAKLFALAVLLAEMVMVGFGVKTAIAEGNFVLTIGTTLLAFDGIGLLISAVGSPLMHLVRNAADHGLETPAERVSAGKTEQGRITLTAAQKGKDIHITVADDGRGLDRTAILKKARETGLVSATLEPDDKTVWNYIFKPGFPQHLKYPASPDSGVGMDVVQSAIHAFRGRDRAGNRTRQGHAYNPHHPFDTGFSAEHGRAFAPSVSSPSRSRSSSKCSSPPQRRSFTFRRMAVK